MKDYDSKADAALKQLDSLKLQFDQLENKDLERVFAQPDGEAIREKLEKGLDSWLKIGKVRKKMYEELKANPNAYTDEQKIKYNNLYKTHDALGSRVQKMNDRMISTAAADKKLLNSLNFEENPEQAECVDKAYKAVLSKKYGTWGNFVAWTMTQACPRVMQAVGYLCWLTTNDKDVQARWTRYFNNTKNAHEMAVEIFGYSLFTRAGRTVAIFAGLGLWDAVYLTRIRARARRGMKSLRKTRKKVLDTNRNTKGSAKEKGKKLLDDLADGYKEGFKKTQPGDYKKMMKEGGEEAAKNLDDAAKYYAKEVLEKSAKETGGEITEQALKKAMRDGLKSTAKKHGIKVGVRALGVMAKVLGPIGLVVEIAAAFYEVCSTVAPAGEDPTRPDDDSWGTAMGVDWGTCIDRLYHGIDHAGDSYKKFKARKKKFLKKKKESTDPKLTMPYDEWNSWPDDMQCFWCTNGPPSDVEGQGPTGTKPKYKGSSKTYIEASGPSCIEVLSRNNCKRPGAKKILRLLKNEEEENKARDLLRIESEVTPRARSGGSWGWNWSYSDLEEAKEHGSFPFPAFYPKTVRFATYRGGIRNDKVWMDFVPFHEDTKYVSEMVRLLKDCIEEGDTLSFKEGVIGTFKWNERGSLLSDRNTNLVLEMDGKYDWQVEDVHAEVYQSLIPAIFKKWQDKGYCYVLSGIRGYFYETGRQQMGGSWRKYNYDEISVDDINESASKNKLINNKGVNKQMSNTNMNSLDKKIFDIINEEINKEVRAVQNEPPALLNEIVKGVGQGLKQLTGFNPKAGGAFGKGSEAIKKLGLAKKAAADVNRTLETALTNVAKLNATDADGYAKAVQPLLDSIKKNKAAVDASYEAAKQAGAKGQDLNKIKAAQTAFNNIENAITRAKEIRQARSAGKGAAETIPVVQKKTSLLRKAVTNTLKKVEDLKGRSKIIEKNAEALKRQVNAISDTQDLALKNIDGRLKALEQGMEATAKLEEGVKTTVKQGGAATPVTVKLKPDMNQLSDKALADIMNASNRASDNARIIATDAIGALNKQTKVADGLANGAKVTSSATLANGARVTAAGLWDATKKLTTWGTIFITAAVITTAAIAYKATGAGEKVVDINKTPDPKFMKLSRCADGDCGTATFNAIKAYSGSKGIKENIPGYIGSETAKALVADSKKYIGKEEGKIDPDTLKKKGGIAGCKWVSETQGAQTILASGGVDTTEKMQAILHAAGFSAQLCAFGRAIRGGGGGGGRAKVKTKKKDRESEKKKKPLPPAKKPDPNVLKVESARFGKGCAKKLKKPRPLMRLTIATLDKDAWQASLSTTAKEQIRLEMLALSQYERENPNGEESMFAGMDYLIKRFYLYTDGLDETINGASWRGITKIFNNKEDQGPDAAIAEVDKAIGKPGNPRPGVVANFEGLDLGRDDNLDILEDQLNAVIGVLSSNIKSISSVKATQDKERQTGGRKDYLVYSIKAEIVDPFTGAPLSTREGLQAVQEPVPIFVTELEEVYKLPPGASPAQINTAMFQALMTDSNVGLLKSGRILNPKTCQSWADALNDIHFAGQEVYTRRDFDTRASRPMLRLHPDSTGVDNNYLDDNNAILRFFSKDECGDGMPRHDGVSRVRKEREPAPKKAEAGAGGDADATLEPSSLNLGGTLTGDGLTMNPNLTKGLGNQGQGLKQFQLNQPPAAVGPDADEEDK